jgi:phosphatidylglycerol:prolipoprotein diacylglycerol transferase
MSIMFIYPDIPPAIAISIGPLDIRWYGLMYLIGLLIAWWGIKNSFKKNAHFNLDPKDAEDLIFYTAFGLILGGRIGYMLFYGWQNLINDPLSLVRVWEGGMSFHGGLLGGFFGIYYFAKAHKIDLGNLLDVIVPWVPPGLFFGRVGNFLNGELWGSVASPDIWWAFIVRGVPRHPSQLYEALFEGLLLFIMLQYLSLKPKPKFFLSGVFLLSYGVARFAIEFVRLPDLHMNPDAGGYIAFNWLTMGQILTAPLILIGIIMISFSLKKRYETVS